MPRVYITPPSYAIQNPAGRARTLKKAQTWADAFGWGDWWVRWGGGDWEIKRLGIVLSW